MIFFWIRLKNASTIAFWVAAAMVPAVVLALGILLSGPGLAIQVGIYGELTIYDGAEWTVVRYDDRERMRQDVANRRLELGYAAGENGITLYTSPATVTDRVTNLLVAATYLETIAGEIGANVLSLYMEADAADIQARTEEFLADGPLMERVVVAHSNGEQESVIPFRRLFHGLLALFAQLLAMLCAFSFANQKERDVRRRLKAAGRWKETLYIISGIGVIFVLTGIVMVAVILPGAWMFPGVWAIQNISVLLPYLLFVSILAMFLTLLLPEAVYPGVLVASFIFTALMGGVIFDLREVLDSVGFLRFLFPSHYYMAAVGV